MPSQYADTMPESEDHDAAALARELDAFVRSWWRSDTRMAVLRAAGVNLNTTDTDTLWDLQSSGPSRPQHVAARIRIGAPSITKAAARLSSAGLVASAPDATDGRATLLSLTPAGEEVARRLRDTGDDVIGRLVSDWTSDEVRQFTRLTARLLAASTAFTDES